jgi:myo-inositol-1(or 4)-monophosphatase
MSGIKLARALDVAQTAVRAAGRFIQDSRARIGQAAIERKAPGDVASSIACEAEALIRARLAAVFPEHGFIGAELGGTIDARRAQWLIDPIDGSANYLHGYPQYAVSLALQHHGEAVLGVVYDPNRDELFTAARGGGALCNGVKLMCSTRTAPIESLAATVFPKPQSERLPQYLAEFGRMLGAFGGVRRSGAMTLELAYLAAGRLEVFWAHDLGAWDAAAGIVLLREAGARFEALDRAPLLSSRSLLAAAPGVFAPVRSLLVGV